MDNHSQKSIHPIMNKVYHDTKSHCSFHVWFHPRVYMESSIWLREIKTFHFSSKQVWASNRTLVMILSKKWSKGTQRLEPLVVWWHVGTPNFAQTVNGFLHISWWTMLKLRPHRNGYAYNKSFNSPQWRMKCWVVRWHLE